MKRCVLLRELGLRISSLVLCAFLMSSAVPTVVEGQPDDGWMQDRTSISPAEPTPEDEIILTISRWANTGGYSLEITDVRIEGDEIWVDFVLHCPGPSAFVTHAFTRNDDSASLGRLEPGTYTLYTSQDGGAYGAALTFTVYVEAPDGSSENSPDDDSGIDEGVAQGHVPPLVINVPAQTCDCICHRWPALFSGRPCPFCGCDPGYSSDANNSSGAGTLLDSLRQRIADLRQR